MTQRLLALLLSVMSSFAANDESKNQINESCRARKDLAGACFAVRGRLRAYDEGYPSCRLWPIGTKRLIGVPQSKDPTRPSLPSNLDCGPGFEVYADFVICPLTSDRPGSMQLVCVEKATHIRAAQTK